MMGKDDTPAWPGPVQHADPLRAALVDSRQRWRDLVTLASDIAFETDSAGRFVFVSPATVLGWQADALLDRPATLLLAGGSAGEAGFDPFRLTVPVRGRRAWLQTRGGGVACLSFSAAPLVDEMGRIAGVRGVGQDVTEQESGEAAVAAAMRRTDIMDQILWRMRQEVLAPRMMQVTLEALAAALGAEGAAVIDVGNQTVLHQTGGDASAVLPAATVLIRQAGQSTGQAIAPDGRKLLACPCDTRFGEQAGLVLWRHAAGRHWDEDDLALIGSITALVRVVLEHASIQREMARQARTDPLTGLLNRRAFREELNRRFERLDRTRLPGTLLFVDLDSFKLLNDAHGHEVGDSALCIAANLLRNTVRPSDLVARLGGDEFALWLDGADESAAAERAEQLRIEGPRALAHLGEPSGPSIGMSIGIAVRRPGTGERLDSLMHRADQAMYEVKRAGRGHWRISRADGHAAG